MKITRERLSELFELIFDIGEHTKSVKEDPYVLVLYSNIDGTLEISVNTNGFQKPMDGFDKKYSFDLNKDVSKIEWNECMNELLYCLDILKEGRPKEDDEELD